MKNPIAIFEKKNAPQPETPTVSAATLKTEIAQTKQRIYQQSEALEDLRENLSAEQIESVLGGMLIEQSVDQGRIDEAFGKLTSLERQMDVLERAYAVQVEREAQRQEADEALEIARVRSQYESTVGELLDAVALVARLQFKAAGIYGSVPPGVLGSPVVAVPSLMPTEENLNPEAALGLRDAQSLAVRSGHANALPKGSVARAIAENEQARELQMIEHARQKQHAQWRAMGIDPSETEANLRNPPPDPSRIAYTRNAREFAA